MMKNIEQLDPITAITLHNIGNTCFSLRKSDEALKYFNSALEIKKRTFGLDHPETAETLAQIGSTYRIK